MLQPRSLLVHLAPLCLAACVLPHPSSGRSPLRAPRPDDRFDEPAPTVDEARAAAIEATSASDAFGVTPAALGPPALRLEFDPDCAGTLGTPIPLTLHVFNDGPGRARELIVLAALPPELAGPGDRAILELVRPELGPGESASLRAALTAHRAGQFSVDALASSIDGPIVGPVRAQVLVHEAGHMPLTEQDEVARIAGLEAILVSVADPAPAAPTDETATPPETIRLQVITSGDVVFVGDRTDYLIRVTNTGETPRNDLALRTSLEEGLDLLSCSGATEVTSEDTERFGLSEGREIHAAPLVSLAPGETAEWRLVARSYRPGGGRLQFTVTCEDVLVREETVTTSFREWSR